MNRAAEKARRRRAILELIGEGAIPSQDALARALRRRGFRVTQATLSRDLKELRVSRVPTEDGYRYAPAEADTVEREGGRLAEQEVLDVDANEQVIVVRTLSGRAQGVGVYLDSLRHPEVLGTLAGDDTVIILPRRVRNTTKLRTTIEKLFGIESD
ncbi:MAG: arginine repressor [Candidatus Eiseniibacteriota bacterium]